MNSFKTWLCIWLVAASLSVYVRLYPIRAHIWDPSYDQATMLVVYNIKKSFLDLIHSQAPQIPSSVAEQMATEKLNETLHKDSSKVQSLIENANRKIFEASHQKANIYLLESDTFYFYYLTESIVKTGKMAEVVKGSKYLDPLMTAPDGYWQPLTYHPYVGYYIYKILKIFDPNISLMSAVAYTPVIITVLFLGAFLMACRVLGLSAISSFVACLFFSLAPVILKRSALGWYRTDPYNLLFTILLLTVLLKAIIQCNSKNYWKYAIVFGLIITAFASIWQGWGFMLAMTAAILGACSLYSLLIKDLLSSRRYLLLGSTILISTILGISFLFGFGEFFTLLKEGLGELQKFTVKEFGLWPNLFMEVGELKKSSKEDFILDSGGTFFLLASLGGFFYSFWQLFKKRQKDYTLKIMALSVFFIVCIIMTIYAERFSIFAMIGLGLFFAIGIEGILHLRFFLKLYWLRIILTLLLTFFIFVNANKNIRTVLTPIFNSAWEKALIDIRNKTPQDSIINCWWPPGHFIKGISHRRVMFDGATLSQSATGYWMANILLNENESQAIGLLRMLNLSGNKAVDFLIAKGFKTSQAVALLITIASKSNQEASSLLEALLHNREDVKNLLMLIRGGYPHSYMLLYNELVDNNLGLTFMGKWNIQRVETLNENPSLLASVPTRGSAAYIDFLWNLAGGQTHYSPALQLLKEDETNYYFNENLVINKVTMKALINSPVYGQGAPISIVYSNNNRIVENLNLTGSLKYAVVLYKQDDQIMARLMDRDLGNSLLIKLFFFNATGMEHFSLLTSSNDLTNRTQIKVFEIQW